MKAVIIVTVMLLTAYPLAELTRYITVWNSWTGAANRADNLAELGVMWVLYLLVPVFLNWAINAIRRMK